MMKHKKRRTDENKDVMKVAVDCMFTQMSANKGIKEFGERAIAAM